MAKVAILIDRQAAERKWTYGINVFETYLGEILSHTGIPFEWMEDVTSVDRERCDVVLVACDEEEEKTADVLWRFAEQGGLRYRIRRIEPDGRQTRLS